MTKFDIVVVDDDGTTEAAHNVDAKFLKKFFKDYVENSEYLEVGGVVTVRVVA